LKRRAQPSRPPLHPCCRSCRDRRAIRRARET
jgi:hypothetical protein